MKSNREARLNLAFPCGSFLLWLPFGLTGNDRFGMRREDDIVTQVWLYAHEEVPALSWSNIPPSGSRVGDAADADVSLRLF